MMEIWGLELLCKGLSSTVLNDIGLNERFLKILTKKALLTILPYGLLGLKEGGEGNVVLGHDAVDHVMGALGRGHGQLVELQ